VLFGIAVGALTAVVFNALIPQSRPVAAGEHILDESPVATPHASATDTANMSR